MQSIFEKLFVSFIVLFWMFLLTLFGIYFDVGEMFVAMIGQEDTGLNPEDSRRLQDLAENARRQGREGPRDLPSERTGADSELTPEETSWYFGRFEMKASDMVKVKEAQLKELGYTDAAFLRMESLAMNQDEYRRAKKEVGALYSEGMLPQAIAMLESAIQKEDSDNLIVIRSHYEMLLALCYEQPDMAKADDVLAKLKSTIDRIVAIKRQGMKDRPSDLVMGEVVALEHQKNTLDEVHKDAVKRAQSLGKPNAFSDEEKATMKKMLDDALASKMLGQEDYDRAMKEIEK